MLHYLANAHSVTDAAGSAYTVVVGSPAKMADRASPVRSELNSS